DKGSNKEQVMEGISPKHGPIYSAYDNKRKKKKTPGCQMNGYFANEVRTHSYDALTVEQELTKTNTCITELQESIKDICKRVAAIHWLKSKRKQTVHKAEEE
ncbi:hypothetical protein BG005_005227, partial [Podila minutissima]